MKTVPASRGRIVREVGHNFSSLVPKLPAADNFKTIVIVAVPSGSGVFDAFVDGFQICRWRREPHFTAARVVLAKGYSPATTVLLRHAGSDTDWLRAKLATSAKLTVS